jgi:hypothetical protein
MAYATRTKRSQPGGFEGLVAPSRRGDIVDERGAPDRDSAWVVESAPSGRNPRGLGDTDNIAPSGR